MINRLWCVTALSVLIAVTVASSAWAFPKPPQAKYKCFQGSTFTLAFKLKSATKYVVNGKGGKYSVKGKKAKFKTGPFAGEWVGKLKGRDLYTNRPEYTIWLTARNQDFYLDCYGG